MKRAGQGGGRYMTLLSPGPDTLMDMDSSGRESSIAGGMAGE